MESKNLKLQEIRNKLSDKSKKLDKAFFHQGEDFITKKIKEKNKEIATN